MAQRGHPTWRIAWPSLFHTLQEDAMQETKNAPAIIQSEAKNRALKIIEQNKDCMSYVRPEDLSTSALFVPVVSVIKPTQDDFYPLIPKVGIMAKPQLVNLICEKAGVEILRTETEKRGRYTWVAHVYGQKRQPDGTMLPKDASYEWDAENRAEEDILRQPDKYKTDTQKRLHVLELAKFGEQRAVTGAQHALIHKLAHVARSFQSPQELMRGMIVARVDRNIDGVLADPEMRQAALDRMLGATESIYGPTEHEQQRIEAPTEDRPQTVADDDEPFTLESESADSEKTEEQKHREDVVAKLEEWALSYDNHGQPRAAQSLRAIAADDSVDLATLESYLNSAADRAQKAGW